MFRASPLFAGMFYALNNSIQKQPALCMSPEEEAVMLQKMMHE